MKKLILILLPLSILAIACSPAQSDTNVTSTAPTEKAQNKQDSRMQGTWNVVASVKDPQYQANQEFTFEVK